MRRKRKRRGRKIKPYIAITNGSKNATGGRLLIVSGLHGNESRSVAVHSRLFQELQRVDQSVTSSTVYERILASWSSITHVIGANEVGLLNDERDTGLRYSPADMNRMFSEERPVVDVIKEIASNSDVVLDIHNSPNCADMLLFTIDPKAKRLQSHIKYAETAGIPYAVWRNATPTLKAFVNELDKDGFTMELSGLGITGYDGELPEVLERFLTTPYVKPSWGDMLGAFSNWVTPSFSVFSTVEGLVTFAANPGDLVIAGSQVCRVSDYAGNTIETFDAPVNGRVIDAPENFVVSAGTELFRIQPLAFAGSSN